MNIGPYANDSRANAVCDRCGFTYLRSELRRQIKYGVLTGLEVCPDCLDVDSEQYKVGRGMGPEPIAVRDPRPADIVQVASMAGITPTPQFGMLIFTGQVFAS